MVIRIILRALTILTFPWDKKELTISLPLANLKLIRKAAMRIVFWEIPWGPSSPEPTGSFSRVLRDKTEIEMRLGSDTPQVTWLICSIKSISKGTRDRIQSLAKSIQMWIPFKPHRVIESKNTRLNPMRNKGHPGTCGKSKGHQAMYSKPSNRINTSILTQKTTFQYLTRVLMRFWINWKGRNNLTVKYKG